MNDSGQLVTLTPDNHSVRLFHGDVIDGGAGDDVIHGGHGYDKIIGGDGVNTIYGDAGNDVIDAGTGRQRSTAVRVMIS